MARISLRYLALFFPILKSRMHTMNQRLAQMYPPPKKNECELEGTTHFSSVEHVCTERLHRFISQVKRAQKKGYTRLHRVWSACAQNGKRVCCKCKVRSLSVWNAFTQSVKRVGPACHMRLIYTWRLVGSVASTWLESFQKGFKEVWWKYGRKVKRN